MLRALCEMRDSTRVKASKDVTVVLLSFLFANASLLWQMQAKDRCQRGWRICSFCLV